MQTAFQTKPRIAIVLYVGVNHHLFRWDVPHTIRYLPSKLQHLLWGQVCGGFYFGIIVIAIAYSSTSPKIPEKISVRQVFDNYKRAVWKIKKKYRRLREISTSKRWSCSVSLIGILFPFKAHLPVLVFGWSIVEIESSWHRLWQRPTCAMNSF